MNSLIHITSSTPLVDFIYSPAKNTLIVFNHNVYIRIYVNSIDSNDEEKHVAYDKNIYDTMKSWCTQDIYLNVGDEIWDIIKKLSIEYHRNKQINDIVNG